MTTALAEDALWFLDDLAIVRLSDEDGAGRISLVEITAPEGDTPPLHLHRNDDEASRSSRAR